MKYFLQAAFFGSFMVSPILSGGLTYDTALQKTLIQSPRLITSLFEIEEREGERVQSGIYLNPLFSYSVENVLGNHHWKNWESAESRYEIAQQIPIGGKMGYRSRMIDFQICSAQLEHSYLELHIAGQLKKAFLEVVAAQELLQLAIDQRKISKKILDAILIKTECGKVSIIEKNKAALRVANTELALQKAHTNLDVAKQELALFWGASCPDFEAVEYPFFQFECPPSFSDCLQMHCSHPLLLKAQYEQLASIESLKLEKAIAIPDVIVTAGYKTLRDHGDKGVILGVAFPLSIFDRNQGNIQRSKAQSCRISNAYYDLEKQLESRLSTLHKQALRLYHELIQIKTIVVQLAEESFEIVQEGYTAGKFEYIHLLDAQITLFESQEQYVEALLQFFEKQTDIEYLTL